MKKLFLGAALAVSSLSFAQQFGAKAGVNVSSIGGDTWTDSKAKPGFYAGVFMNAPLASSFSIQPEVLYSQYGAKVIDNSIQKTNLNLGYVTVPVMFQYNVVPSFYLEAGPEFGFLVNSNAKTTYKDSNLNNPDRVEINTDNFNKFNMGVGLGLGYNFTQNIGVNARYVAGLNDLDKSENVSAKNGTFQAGLNFKF